MTNKYSKEKYGDGSYGGQFKSLLKGKLVELFPDVMDKDESSILYKYLDAHDEMYTDIGRDLEYVRASNQVDNARSTDLDKIGAIFGTLGRRRGRSDSEYRSYLKGLLQTFNARGTKPGLKFAVASAVNTDTDNVTIVENVGDTSYDIRIDDTDAQFLSSVVNDVAELADPSGVDLANPPVVLFDGADIQISVTESQVISSSKGIGANTLTLDGNSQLG